jgi:2-polyprenyl-6-methoxyphenol hydroxylase-like FAD-dependent oxidoreductase
MGGERVVVVGASLAGLFAAAAAAVAGCKVTVLEQDQLRDDDQPRRGVPQGRQPHILLHRGLVAAEALMPGLRSDLISAGGVAFDTGDLPWLGEFGWFPLGRPAFEVVSVTRLLLEKIVRHRVLALPDVEIREGVRVTGLRSSRDGWEVEVAGSEPVPASLVVDASGRSSRLPKWLTALGIPAATTIQVDAKVGYATRLYAATPDAIEAPGVVVLATPETLTGGLALRVEHGHWLVLAVGYGQRRPPRDAEGFEAFLRGLHDRALADIVRRAVPQSDVAVHRQTANQRHHYEKVRGWPAGLLVVGDALCAFNPVYGQGITVAARELLRSALTSGFEPHHARKLLRRFTSVTSLPWAVATNEDVRFPTGTTQQSPTQRLLDWWTREVALLAVHGNGRAQDTLTSIYHLMGSPAQFLHPALPAAAIRARVRGYGPSAPRPHNIAALANP